MILYHNVKQGTDGWDEIREGKYTGTAAAKLLRFGAIEYAKTAASGFSGNFYTERGHILEDEAIELFERVNGLTVDRPGFVTNSAIDGCGYSPDGVVKHWRGEASLLIEVKCFNKTKHKAIALGEIPFEILAQIHFGLFICDIREARLVLYNPEFARKKVEIDGELVDNPDYNPRMALVFKTVKRERSIDNNFKRRLEGVKI